MVVTCLNINRGQWFAVLQYVYISVHKLTDTHTHTQTRARAKPVHMVQSSAVTFNTRPRR